MQAATSTQSPCPPPHTPYGPQRYHCHPPHHHLSHVGHQPPKATSPSPAEGTLRRGRCPERGRRGRWDGRHCGAGRRRRIPRGPGQVSSATGKGRADHPSHPPYLGVLRPTVMDTIETPKIDRLHRLGAVSLTVRAGWGWGGVRRWGQLAGGTVLPPAVLADPVLLPSCQHAKGTASRSQRMQRAVTRAHARWVSWLRGLRRRLQSADALDRRAELPPALPGRGEPRGQLRLRGVAQEPPKSRLHPGMVAAQGDETSQGFMLSTHAGLTVAPGKSRVAWRGPSWGYPACRLGGRSLPACLAPGGLCPTGPRWMYAWCWQLLLHGSSGLAPHTAAAPVGPLCVPSLWLHLPCPHASPRGTPRCRLGPRAAPQNP